MTLSRLIEGGPPHNYGMQFLDSFLESNLQAVRGSYEVAADILNNAGIRFIKAYTTLCE